MTAFKGVLYKLHDPLVFPIYHYTTQKIDLLYNTALYRKTTTYVAPELA